MSALKRSVPGVLAVAVGLALAPAAAAATAPAPVTYAASAPTQQDSDFLVTIHQVNLTEIAAGRMAEQRGQNQQVKQLGAEFANDHQQLDQSVTNTARSAGVNLPNGPSQAQQTVLDQLQATGDSQFDTAWVSTQLLWHMRAISATETEMAQGTDNAIKQVAQTAKPILEKHLQQLQALAQSMGIPIPGATATPEGGATSPPPTGRPTTGGPTTGGPTTGGPTTGGPGAGPRTGSPTSPRTTTPAPSPTGS